MPRACRSHDSTSQVVLQTVTAYERSADEFLSRWGQRRYRQPLLLRRWLVHVPKAGLVLDLGCGAGQDAKYLRQQGYRVIGLDRTESLLAFSRRRSATLPLVRADLRHLPLRPGHLDGIWAAASLIHLPKTIVRAVLAGVLDRIRPGAVLAATFTHGRVSRITQRGWIPGRYVARWKKNELLRAFSASGWQVIELRVVIGQERKGRWINLIARRPSNGLFKSSSLR